MKWKILQGDALKMLKGMPDGSAHTCVTSPPYWSLRDYRVPGQIGMERTPTEYVAALVPIFSEVRRVLVKGGTLWLNVGDTWATRAGSGKRMGGTGTISHYRKILEEKHYPDCPPNRLAIEGLKAKDLVGIPWLLAFALRAEGWWLRSEIIWSKPNGIPSSAKDRPAHTHETIFLLSNARRYYFDYEAVNEPAAFNERNRRVAEANRGLQSTYLLKRDAMPFQPLPGKTSALKSVAARQRLAIKGTRRRRSVWTVSVRPFPEAHAATFPPRIPELCIRAGCPEGGTVLDPFTGAGTTGVVATRLNRDFVGIEISPEYVAMARKRIENDAPLFNRKKKAKGA